MISKIEYIMKGKTIAFLLLLSFCFSFSAFSSPRCSNNKFCGSDVLGEQFDYRGQSTFGRLSPGDTTRVKVVLYSNNDVRIALCADEILGDVNFKVIKTIREYSRTVDRVEKRKTEKPVYKTDDAGKKIPKKTATGQVKVDEYGDIQYEVELVETIEETDTIWKTLRNVREEVLYTSTDSKEKKEFFQERITKTTSVIIEVVVPPLEEKAEVPIEGCVGIMVGRRYAK